MKNIYINGQIYTGKLPLVQAFAVENGRFIFAGTAEDALKLKAEEDTVTDLEGRFVCCGFNDSHMHLLNFGQALSCAQLAQRTQSLKDMLLCLKEYASSAAAAGRPWIIGRGWNQDYYTDVHRLPNRYDLDEVSAEKPVAIIRCCGHCLTVNSKVLELIGIDENTPCPDGGKIGMLNGKPDGCFFDNAMDLVYAHVPVPSKEDLKYMIKAACKALNSYGVTSSQTDDFCVFRTVPWQTVVDAYKELEAEGELTVRVYEQNNFTSLEGLKEFVAAGNNTGAGTYMYKSGPLKILGDGSLGARTAFLSAPYSDDPASYGFPVFTQETMTEMVSYANSIEMQVAIHAIGDKCLDYVLNAVENALAENPKKDHRHGVVHCQISRPDQLERMKKLNMHIYAQSIFLDYDNHIIYDRIGKERAVSSYAWKSLMNSGLCVSNGTDCPVELPDALACMQCGITRTTLHDNIGPYLPDEAFTVREAIDTYTINGAKASFEENIKGMIKPGYLADFVILDQNLFSIDPYTIKDVKVCETYLGGKRVF